MTDNPEQDASLGSTPTKASFHPRDWPEAALALKALEGLTQAGYATLFAGGAVRDALLGRTPQDFDLATVALPRQVMAALEPLGFRFVLTGIEHGTVVAATNGQKVEITTLRRDVETDGRHARVAFTQNWQEDAARRDLTINALYADANGAIQDFAGGLDDLARGVVRFVGDPAARVTEDALRILRFFRFHGAYGRSDIDAAGLAACIAARASLAHLSGERIWAEVRRLLVTPRAAEVLQTMHAHDVLTPVLRLASPEDAGFAKLAELEIRYAEADPIRRLALLLPDAAQVRPVAERLKLSRDAAQRLGRLLTPPDRLDSSGIGHLLHHEGQDLVRDWLLLKTVRTKNDLLLTKFWDIVCGWRPKAFPLTGEDLVDIGINPGPALGARLAALEDWWLTADRAPDRAACLAELGRRLVNENINEK